MKEVKNLFNKSKTAFTLAEVLVTLAIIGVVAALTIPSVVISYQKHATATKLKKTYNILQQVLSQSELENGPHKYWDYTLNSQNFFDKYLKKYLINQKASSLTAKKFIGVDYHYHPNGNIFNNVINSQGYPKVILNDGIILAFGRGGVVSPQHICLIEFDINGVKGPNAYGVDVFGFQIHRDYNFVMPECQDYNRSQLLNNSTFGCNKTSTFGGQCCSALIMKDNWQIKDDYPW